MGKDKSTWVLIATEQKLAHQIRVQSARVEHEKTKLTKLVREHLKVLNQIEERKR